MGKKKIPPCQATVPGSAKISGLCTNRGRYSEDGKNFCKIHFKAYIKKKERERILAVSRNGLLNKVLKVLDS